MPDLLVISRQRSIRYDHGRLVLLVENALPLCLKVAERLKGPLLNLGRIECSVVGNRAMARVHREFLNARTTTDVITFPDGEILVCAPVAQERAGEFGHDVPTELALYCIHGLLHLAGHDDLEQEAARRMARAQEEILHAAGKNRQPAGRSRLAKERTPFEKVRASLRAQAQTDGPNAKNGKDP